MQTKEHPDDLTPREREVLDLVRLGLTNEEIAERLGISLDGAKYHVSQILSKLGVPTREEAAAQATATHVAEAFEPRRRRWWVALPLAAKAASVAVIVAAVAGLGLLAWGVARTESGEGDGSVQGQCDASQLAVGYLGDNRQGSDTITLSYGFGNSADALCWMSGPPEVQLLDASGDQLAILLEHAEPCSSFEPQWLPLGLCEQREPILLRENTDEIEPHEVGSAQAFITLAWQNGQEGDSCGSSEAETVRFRLSGGGFVDTDVPDAVLLAPCGGQLQIQGFIPTRWDTPTRTPSTDDPRIGDHWHAPYSFTACGEKQPNAPVWESGVHTHGDGILHIHPFQTWEEGAGASLVNWFEYGGGQLTETVINIPGSAETFRNGDLCPDGQPGEVQVFVTHVGESAEVRPEGDALQQYIPQDGDRIRIVFGSPEDPIEYGADGEPTLPPAPATRP